MRARPYLSWLLALFLLWGQTAAFAHALEHVDEAAVHAPCELCVGQAQLGGSAPPATPFVFAVAARSAPVVAAPTRLSHTAAPRPRARAPPAAPLV